VSEISRMREAQQVNEDMNVEHLPLLRFHNPEKSTNMPENSRLRLRSNAVQKETMTFQII
jgi:hypothetical protein